MGKGKSDETTPQSSPPPVRMWYRSPRLTVFGRSSATSDNGAPRDSRGSNSTEVFCVTHRDFSFFDDDDEAGAAAFDDDDNDNNSHHDSPVTPRKIVGSQRPRLRKAKTDVTRRSNTSKVHKGSQNRSSFYERLHIDTSLFDALTDAPDCDSELQLEEDVGREEESSVPLPEALVSCSEASPTNVEGDKLVEGDATREELSTVLTALRASLRRTQTERRREAARLQRLERDREGQLQSLHREVVAQERAVWRLIRHNFTFGSCKRPSLQRLALRVAK